MPPALARGVVRTAIACAVEPLAELLAHVRDRLPGVAERALHAIGVVLAGGVGLLARRRLLAAADVLAGHDAVVFALADPGEELVGALDGHRMGQAEIDPH